ncbi:MAG: hypothetical protein ACI87A_003161 [Planctomycetota bacterium]|jgi:hypothetical protein
MAADCLTRYRGKKRAPRIHRSVERESLLDSTGASTGASSTSLYQFLFAAISLAALFQLLSLRSIQKRSIVSAARVH